MVAWAIRSAVLVLADRKGSTAVEYALIAATAAVVLLGAFQPLFERIVALLPTLIP